MATSHTYFFQQKWKVKRLISLSLPSGTGAVGGAMLEYFEGKVLPGIAAVQS
jgi:hypothetical protein